MTKKRKVNSVYEVEGPDDDSPDGHGPVPGLSPAAIAAATLAAAKAIGRVRANAAAAAAKAMQTSGKASGKVGDPLSQQLFVAMAAAGCAMSSSLSPMSSSVFSSVGATEATGTTSVPAQPQAPTCQAQAQVEPWQLNPRHGCIMWDPNVHGAYWQHNKNGDVKRYENRNGRRKRLRSISDSDTGTSDERPSPE